MARWEHAFDELLNYGLIRDMGHEGEIFELTANGFAAADQAKAAAEAKGAEETGSGQTDDVPE